MCVEFFELNDGRLVVNEIAPRPHNSGHYTLDACLQSQFELQVRMMVGLPHGQLNALQPTIMLNLLGDLWFDSQGHLNEPDWVAALSTTGTKLYLYGKEEARPGRKMGHINVLADSVNTVQAQTDQLAKTLGFSLR